MAYATVNDVQARMARTLSSDEQSFCNTRLEDAAAYIDAAAPNASEESKCIVSCNMVIRILGDGSESGIPMGATQGSMAALGYSQSWTISGGSSGELYLSKSDKRLLGIGNSIGSYSPVEEITFRGCLL